MRYFIPSGKKLKEVNEKEYDDWALYEIQDYLLPGYSLMKGDILYSMETMYKGACDKDEIPPLPFILFYFEDEFIISEDGISKPVRMDITECFESFDELQKRRNELIKKIEAEEAFRYEV